MLKILLNHDHKIPLIYQKLNIFYYTNHTTRFSFIFLNNNNNNIMTKTIYLYIKFNIIYFINLGASLKIFLASLFIETLS